jgi:hypothetical protein
MRYLYSLSKLLFFLSYSCLGLTSSISTGNSELFISSHFLNINYGKHPDWVTHTYHQKIRSTFCSFEFLGYSLFDSLPSSGQLSVTFASSSSPSSSIPLFSSKCYYQILSEKWRPMLKPFYSIGIFYCPILEMQSKLLMREVLLVSHQVSVGLSSPFNSSQFFLNTYQISHQLKRGFNNSTRNMKQKNFTSMSHPSTSTSIPSSLPRPPPQPQSSPTLAPPTALKRSHLTDEFGICTVLPYSPLLASEIIAMKKIFVKWVEHHTKLGFRIFLYDHDALLQNLITSFSSEIMQKLHYSNVTIYSSLQDPFQSENLIRYYDNDKVLTLTHCRFDARATYGIEKVTSPIPSFILFFALVILSTDSCD